MVHYGVKNLNHDDLNLNLKHDFNFLTVAQVGPRKNLLNTIKWFLDEFKEEEVGLIVKAHWMNNSLKDRTNLTNMIRSSLNNENRKCSIYLVHGDMTDAEIHGLYKHPKVKCYMTATHGEGFGLPIFEAAYSGLPVVAPSWSGHVDFLSAPVKNSKSGKVKTTSLYEKVAYDLNTPVDDALWKDVIEKDSKWCYPKEDKFKQAMRNVYRSYSLRKKNALILQDHIIKEFNMQDKLEQFNEIVTKVGEQNETI